MPKHVRIGIVGSGFAAHFHLASYQKVYGEDFEIVGVYGRNKEKSAHLAKEWKLKKVWSTYEEMLADKDVDVVDLVVANNMHVPFAIKAAQAGKHVFCEKPLTGYFGPPDAAPGTWTAKGFSRETMMKAAVDEASRAFDAVKELAIGWLR